MKKKDKFIWAIKIFIIVLAIAFNVFIIVNSCLDANQSSNESGKLVNFLVNIINSIKPDAINESNIDIFSSVIRKLVGHFLAFTVSGVSTTLSVKFLYFDFKKKFTIFLFISCSFGLFLAILTECIQLFVPGRSGEIRDILIDFGGYIIGYLVIALITYFINKKNTNLEK